jgi:predicted lipid-binding transport protein (Tim44 family)
MANSDLFEILILAMVAGVIIFRLYSVLGRRTGNERPPQDRFQLSPPADKAPVAADNVVPLPVPRSADAPADPLARGLNDIRQADRNFDSEHFIDGARHAYEMIVTAFAANDRATLKPLLCAEVYAAFDSVMRARDEKKEKVTFTFVGFKDSKITEAVLRGKMADVTVAFSAQFISATSDDKGAVVDGDPKSVREVTDVWSFERNVRASDPNWTLVATSGGEPHS